MKIRIVTAGVVALAAAGARAQFAENFDSYATGSTIAGQGGWEIWYSGGADATVSNAQSQSAPNSLLLNATSDIVQRLDIASGAWTCSAWTYVPSGAVGNGYFIVMNQYQDPPDNWSVVVRFGGDDDIVEDWNFDAVGLVRDRWVEIRAEIDLDADLLDIYYDGVQFVFDADWSDNVLGGGSQAIAAIDLYSESMDFYYDDVLLEPAPGECVADCDGSGTLNIFDFLCFQTAFGNGDPEADCDDNGNLNIFDFLCFQTAFGNGC